MENGMGSKDVARAAILLTTTQSREEETEMNPRARSAKLRVAERV